MVTSLTGAVSVARAPTASEICLRPLISRTWSLRSSTVPPLGTSASPPLTTPTMRLSSGNLTSRSARPTASEPSFRITSATSMVSSAKLSTLIAPGTSRASLKLQSRHLLRVDYEVDPKHLPGERLSSLVVVRVVYTRHGAGNTLGLRRQARDDVHLV